MFDFAKSYGKAVMTGSHTGNDPMDIVNAERQAAIMGIEKTGDFIEDYGNNIMLSGMTNLSSQELSDIEKAEKLMFD